MQARFLLLLGGYVRCCYFGRVAVDERAAYTRGFESRVHLVTSADPGARVPEPRQGPQGLNGAGPSGIVKNPL